MIELYKKAGTGYRYWKIEPDYAMGMLCITHGVLGGSLQYKEDDVEENQSGRTIEDQIDLEIEARAKKKKDIGYRESKEAADEAEGKNTIGQIRPMLAKRYDQIKNVNFKNIYVQMKYDGHRCLITRTTSGLMAYSRRGRRITTIDHILKGIQIPVGMTLDGELYHHGTSLQQISSWVKRKQMSTTKIQYVVYDCVMNEGYGERLNYLSNLRLGSNVVVCPTDKHTEEAHIPMLLDSAISFGYEGLILRDKHSPYEPGARSKGLIKVKSFLDAEYRVIDITASRDGWGILKCETEDGSTFTVSAPGTHSEKERALNEKENYIGHYVTIKYSNLTNDGIPFHPVAERWKEDI